MPIDAIQAGKAELGASRRSARRGWRVVGAAFTVMFVTFGVAYSFSAFFASLQQAFSASRGAISFIFSIAVPLYFLVGAVSGPLADRFGPRGIGLLGIAIGGAGVLFAAQASALWQIYLGFGLGMGLGIGFSYVPVVGAVQRWFVQRRGAASGIAVSGIGLGTLVFPLIAAPLIASIGWRGAWTVFGIFMIVVGGAACLLIDASPESQGLLPDGGVAAAGAERVQATSGVGLREAVFSRTFALLFSALLFVAVGAFIPFVHLVPFAEDRGISHGTAVAVFSMVGVGSTFGRFLLGAVADRFGRRRSLAAICFGMALMLVWWMVATAAWELATFAFVFGSCYGGLVALYPALIVDYFGGRNAGGLIGIVYSAAAVGTLAGPELAGRAFDLFRSYTLPIGISAAFALLGAFLVIATPEPTLHAAPAAQRAS